MKKLGYGYYLTFGLAVFPIGTLLLLRQPSLINLVSNLMPSIETVEIFGLFLQFLGEGLIAYGLIGVISNRTTTVAEINRQIVVAGMNRQMQDQASALAAFKNNMNQQIAALSAKLNQLETSTRRPTVLTLSNCKFCGAKLTPGASFCPQCGKANY